MSSPGLWVLGLSASHNGGACLVHDGRIVVAVQEERLSGVKRDRTYGARPGLAVRYCLDSAGIGADRLDLVVLCAQGSAASAEHDLSLNPELRVVANRVPWLSIPHHLGHAVSAYATSGSRAAAVLVVDGLGSPYEDLSAAERAACGPGAEAGWETLSVYEARGRRLAPVVKRWVDGGRWLDRRHGGMPRFGSLGGMYSAVAEQIFGDPMEAGKVMGLAALGRPVFGPEEFFGGRGSALRFRTGVPERFRHDDRWPARQATYADLAASVQAALEVALLGVVAEVRAGSSASVLCYAGGVALNCVANERLWRGSGFDEVFVPPPAEDSGPAIGAAFHGLWQLSRRHSVVTLRRDGLGRPYSAGEVGAAIARVPGVRVVTDRADRVVEAAATRLAAGEVGGWFEGGSELGPRALGARSIVADPRSHAMKERVNGHVKRREGFRPLAPAILAEHADAWFDTGAGSSPFMLRSWRFRAGCAGRVPAVVHHDGTGRVQTVEPDQLARFHRLIAAFHARTGVPLILNTSLNGPGEPIAETPHDALWCMLDLGLDFVAFEDRIVVPAPDAPAPLDLVPVVACSSYTVRAPATAGAGPDGPRLSVTVRTAWGDRELGLAGTLSTVLALVDGSSTVRELARTLGAGAAGDRVALDAVRLLRRQGVVDLRMPGGGRVPADPPAAWGRPG